MNIILLNHAEVERLLPMEECILVMKQAFAALAAGEMIQPLRTIFRPPDVKGVMGMMPAFRGGRSPIFGLKAICVFPGNAAIGKDAHQGGVLLFDGNNGELVAIVDASAITAIRTAAVSALATQMLAREDAGNLTIIGAGVQARAHLKALSCVRQLERVSIVAQHPEKALRFVKEMQPHFKFSIEMSESVEAADRQSDLIVTATTSRDPVLNREWILPGTHINAIGTFSPKAREIDSATMANATLFVDRRESALNEAGDYLIAAQEGAIGPGSINELAEVLVGSHPGRTSSEEITLFKSLGLAMEDLTAAEYCFLKATEPAAH